MEWFRFSNFFVSLIANENLKSVTFNSFSYDLYLFILCALLRAGCKAAKIDQMKHLLS